MGYLYLYLTAAKHHRRFCNEKCLLIRAGSKSPLPISRPVATRSQLPPRSSSFKLFWDTNIFNEKRCKIWQKESYITNLLLLLRGVTLGGKVGNGPPLFGEGWRTPSLFETTSFQNITSPKHDVYQRSVVIACKTAHCTLLHLKSFLGLRYGNAFTEAETGEPPISRQNALKRTKSH